MADRPNPEFVQIADQLLRELCLKFPMGYCPDLEWKALRVTAGIAYFRKRKIALSTRVLKTEESLRETLTHEYAHLLAISRHGIRAAGHGEGWRMAMRDLGLVPKVRHHLPVERNASHQEVIYRCARCHAEFVRKRRFSRHNRYIHVHCGGELQLRVVRKVTNHESGS